MKAITARRITQIFFFVLFLWLCLVTRLGENWWQLRGWPVNWLIWLDPLVGLATLMTTGVLYAGLIWGVVTIILTLLLGRFFCGWVCPFGALHQFVGWLFHRKIKTAKKIEINQYQNSQAIKYLILALLLSASAGELVNRLISLPSDTPLVFAGAFLSVVVAGVALAKTHLFSRLKSAAVVVMLTLAWAVFSHVFGETRFFAVSIQTGLLDPIPLFIRSFNLVILPLIDGDPFAFASGHSFYPGSFLMALIFFISVFLNVMIPRFYCRVVCPLGALLGIISVNALFRMGKNESTCINCRQCETHCEGACSPTNKIRTNECVLCLNCLDTCKHGVMDYGVRVSTAGEIPLPDVTRRQVVLSIFTGLLSVPVMRANGLTEANWNHRVIRPPGALAEKAFLNRCIKCGQCMRVCPTHVIQPAELESGFEGLWTPMLNFRTGTSGCQHNCIACGHLCPTAAIRPLSLDERMGKNEFKNKGPVRMGMAFIDRGRCLPWAMDRPCIVCQENCPVSPKAIFTRIEYRPVRKNTTLVVKSADRHEIVLHTRILIPGQFSTGDYYCRITGSKETRAVAIADNMADRIILNQKGAMSEPPFPDDVIEILIRLQLPFVDPLQCIGCGVCEHECPVKGKRAIRVSAENETRSREHAIFLNP